MKSQSFIKGTLILLIANIFNRSIGFIYQIVMMRMIKPEGVGLFNIAYPIYILMMVVASMGIPVAVSKLVAEEMAQENPSGAHRIFKTSLLLTILLSFTVTVLVLICSPLLKSHIFPDPRVYHCFLTLLPAIFIVSLCSVFRGYFQGLQMMTPTAITQVGEQIIRIVFGLSLAYLFLPKGIEYAAIGISLGVVLGEVAGFLFMLFIYFKNPINKPKLDLASKVEPLKLTLQKIFNLGLPITLTRFLSTFILSLEAILIPHQLIAWGTSSPTATSIYGQFVGISETLLLTPSVITTAMATALVPAIGEAVGRKNQLLINSRSEEAVRITSIIGIPMVAVFYTLSFELCQTLFGYSLAAIPLIIMAISGPFIYLSQTIIGILNGLGKPSLPFKNMLLSSIIKIGGIYYLTPIYGIEGTSFIIAISYIFMAFLNYRDLKKVTKISLNLKQCFLKPLIASALAGILMWQSKIFFLNHHLEQGLLLILTLLLGGIFYLIILFLLGGIKSQDFNKISLILSKK